MIIIIIKGVISLLGAPVHKTSNHHYSKAFQIGMDLLADGYF